jgi:uncharacterized protein YbjT (DUF2867 family)
MTTLLIVGATGLVGRSVLSQALADPRIERVVAPTRKPLTLTDPRLDNPLVDFAALPLDAAWWACDAVVCTLGTTRKQAGSDAAFRQVDFDYVLAVAQAARKRGATAFVLTSSVGAKAGSHFLYLRTKGEIEAAIAALGYPSYTIVRPAGLQGQRDVPRRGEHLSNGIARALSLVVPRRYRPVSAERVARTLLAAALGADPGQHVIESEAILP